MTNAAAKGRSLLFLAAAFALCAAILAAPAAEATRTLPALAEPAQATQRATLDALEDATPKPPIEPEKRLRLFEDLSWPTHPLELVQISKTASGVFDLGLDCNILKKGGLSQECGSPSFQGLWHDPTTGLAYARNRWYDARTASWLSEDPLGPVDSPNLYAFVAALGGLFARSASIAVAGENAIDKKVAQATEKTAVLPPVVEPAADTAIYIAGDCAKQVVDVVRIGKGTDTLLHGEGFCERAVGGLQDVGRASIILGPVIGAAAPATETAAAAPSALSRFGSWVKGWFKREGDDTVEQAVRHVDDVPLAPRAAVTAPKGTPLGDAQRYQRYLADGGEKEFEDWLVVSRGGRSGGPIHRSIQASLKEQGFQTEVRFGNRAADGYKPGEIHQIGNLNLRGDPIARERDAILDIIESPEYSGEAIFFWDKTNFAAAPIKIYENGEFILSSWGPR
jgi:RHS repeat-associated protein